MSTSQVVLFGESARPSRADDAPRSTGLSAETFVAGFPVLAEANGGIRAVRRLVLDLAIRGRLSTGQPGDSAVQKLLDSATLDRVARLRDGTARIMDELKPVAEIEAPFALPTSWRWTRVGLAMNLVNGRAFKPTDWSTHGLPIVRIQNLNNPLAPFNYCAFDVEKKHLVKPGDFLISWSGTPGTSFGAFIWDGPAGVLNQHIFRIELYGKAYQPEFLRVAINARLDEMIARAHGAVGLQHITKGELESLPIPLPPLAEQKRIVVKVDELVRLLDDLEAKQTKKRETLTRLRTAALDALTSAEGPGEFGTAWKRVAGKFGVLFEGAESIADVRRGILDLATIGRLAPSTRTTRDVGDVLPGLPNNWRWAECSSLCDRERIITYGVIKLGAETSDGVPTLRSSNVRWLRVDETGIKRIAPALAAEFRRTQLRGGEVVITVRGTLGGVAVVPNHLAGGNVSREVAVLPFGRGVSPAFMAMCVASPRSQRWLTQVTKGIAYEGINIGDLRRLPIPVPSLDEQNRIVAKVDHLMKLCDDLEAKLQRAETTAAKLVEAVVAKMVAA